MSSQEVPESGRSGGAYTFMNDLDDAPDTITVDMFSRYAVAYVEIEGADADCTPKCSLCHICQTFLGIGYFIWLAIGLAVIVVVILAVLRRRKDEEQEGRRG